MRRKPWALDSNSGSRVEYKDTCLVNITLLMLCYTLINPLLSDQVVKIHALLFLLVCPQHDVWKTQQDDAFMVMDWRLDGREPPPGKLKDSCDNCAAAIVRCTREKLICSRCRKLGSS